MMTSTAPRFSPASAYRTGLLDGRHAAEDGRSPRLAMASWMRRPAWASQPRRVRRAYGWGFREGWRAALEGEPRKVA